MRHGLRFLAFAVLGAAVGGCMNPPSESEQRSELNQRRIELVNATTQAALSTANTSPGNATPAVDADQIRALGCPLLADFVEDMSTHQGTLEKPLPASAKELFGCFGITGDGTLDDIDVIYDKFKSPEQLLDCICGGDGLSRLFGGNYSAFSAAASKAVDAYDAAQSKATDGFDASNSNAVDGYDGSNASGM